MPVTIQNLDVRFDVEGEGDEAVFSRLFAEHIKQWSREMKERTTRERCVEADRSLGDGRGKKGRR